VVQATSRNVLFYSDEFSWGNVAWYAGFCVSTALGALASTSVIPWVSIPGIVALTAGGLSMLAQVLAWKDSSEIFEFGKTLTEGIKDADANKLNVAVNILITSPETPKILTVFALTVTTSVVCYCSPLGKLVVTKVEAVCQSILEFIGSKLPSGINWNINGINIPNVPAAPIPLPIIPAPKPKSGPVWWNPFTWF